MLTDEKKYGIAPCHFCGTSGLVFGYLEERDVFYVCCGTCGATGPWHETEAGAAALWNRPTLFAPDKSGAGSAAPDFTHTLSVTAPEAEQ